MPRLAVSRPSFLTLAAGLFGALALSACGGGGGGGGGSTTPPGPAVPKVTLTAAASTVRLGATGSLTWSSTDATVCTASEGWTGTQATSGTAATSAFNSVGAVKFTLTCAGAGGTASASVTITANSPLKLLAGDATGSGFADGAASAALFRKPQALTQDGKGNAYVADTDNHTVRKITIDGTVTTLAGQAGTRGRVDATGAAARFDTPQSIALDAASNVYTVDSGSHSLRKITAAGVVTTPVQPYAEALASQTVQPIAVGATPDGSTVLALIAGQTDGFAVAKLDANGQVIKPYRYQSWSPTAVVGAPALSTFTVSAKGEAWMAERAVSVNTGEDIWYLRRFATDGTSFIYFDSTLPTNARIRGLAVDKNDVIYASIDTVDTPSALDSTPVWNTRNHRIIRYDSPGANHVVVAGQGDYEYGYSDGAADLARFYYPVGLSLDADGNLLVADSGNHAIRKVLANGQVATLSGKVSLSGRTDGTGAAAQFKGLSGVASDANGNILVADTLNAVVRKITPDGVVTTLSGVAGSFGTALGSGSNSRFSYLRGSVAVDDKGGIYVADTNFDLDGHSIRSVAAGGSSGIVSGHWSQTNTNVPVDGARVDSRWVSVESGVAISPTGDRLFAIDYDSVAKQSMLRVVTLPGQFTSTPGKALGKAVVKSDTVRFRGIVFNQNWLYAVGTDNKVYKIDPTTGEGTVFAGQGSAGATDGAANVATFDGLEGITADQAGNLYVADGNNGLIRQITPAGVVSTLLGVAGKVTSDWTHYPLTISSPKALTIRGKLLTIVTGNGVLQYTLP